MGLGWVGRLERLRLGKAGMLGRGKGEEIGWVVSLREWLGVVCAGTKASVGWES